MKAPQRAQTKESEESTYELFKALFQILAHGSEWIVFDRLVLLFQGPYKNPER